MKILSALIITVGVLFAFPALAGDGIPGNHDSKHRDKQNEKQLDRIHREQDKLAEKRAANPSDPRNSGQWADRARELCQKEQRVAGKLK